MDQSLGDCGGLVSDGFVKLIRSNDEFMRAIIDGYKRDIKNALVAANLSFMVSDAAKEIKDKPGHKLKSHQAAAQRQMQRNNARKAMCQKSFSARS